MKVTRSIVLCILLCFSCFPFVSDGGGQCSNDSTSRDSINGKTHTNPTWRTLIGESKTNLIAENEEGKAEYPSMEEMISYFITGAFLLVLISTGCVLRSRLEEDSHLLWPRSHSRSEGRQSGYLQRMYAEDFSDINNNNNSTDNYNVRNAM